MTDHTAPEHTAADPTHTDAGEARATAAALFAAAAADEDAGQGTRLRCIAAQLALQAPAPLPRARNQSADTAIGTALTLLATLPVDQFADRRVRAACRHGRAALRGVG